MLFIIVVTLFVSLMINIFLKRFALPTIIGYILTGTVIAYAFGLHQAVNNHTLQEIAEFGVVFLMFTIGLEFSLEHLKRMRYEVFVTGTLQILITAALVYAIGHFVLGLEEQIAFICALAIALSSTAIVLKTFNESGEINRVHGQRALGILIMQDIAVIPILLIIGFMSSSDKEIGALLVHMFFSAIALLGILWLSSKYLLEPFFEQIVKTNSDELFVGTILFLAIGASYLAHAMGFSYSLGAFIAGMLIAETKYKHQAEADLVPFRDLLLGVFFITVGMQIKFDIIFVYMHIVFLLLVGVVVLKFGIIYLLVRARESRRISLKVALSLVQIGEFSLALLELSRSYGLVPSPYGQIMIVTIVLSMILTPFILKKLPAICDLILHTEDQTPEITGDEGAIAGHTIIIGFGEFGQSVAQETLERGELYIALDNNIEIFHRAQKLGASIVFGNAAKKEVLLSTYPQKAKNVIVAIDNPKKLLHVCYTLLELVEHERIIVKVHSKKERDDLAHLGLSNIIVENEISSHAANAIIRDTPLV
ncbi:MAG: cation:proton antiporter [Campylobacterales bacterium]|nr:cation:proton antiporter [Campylobacterales bacterium]